MSKKCTERVHCLTESQRVHCISSKQDFSAFVCLECNKTLVGCKKCAKRGVKKWYHRDKVYHAKLCKPNLEIKVASKPKNQVKNKLCPRLRSSDEPKPLTLAHVQTVRTQMKAYNRPTVIHSFLKGCDASIGFISNRNNLEVTVSAIPDKFSTKKIMENIGKDEWKVINAALHSNGLKPKGGNSFHTWVTGNDWSWTLAHSDRESVLCLLLYGYKIFYLGPKEEEEYSKGWVDLGGNIWTVDTSSYGSHTWNVNERGNAASDDKKTAKTAGSHMLNSKKEQSNLARLYEDAGFKKCPLAPGDAVYLPSRFCHAVHTAPNSVLLSISVEVSNKFTDEKIGVDNSYND